MIEQTIRQKLPEGFQTAEFLLDHGMLDLVVAAREPAAHAGHDPEAACARRRAARGRRRPVGCRRPTAPPRSPTPPSSRPATPGRSSSSRATSTARALLEYIGLIFDDFVELHGDRPSTRTPRSSAASARLGELAVMVIGHQKGHTTSEMLERNFGMPNPEGYRKGMRLMRYAARFGMPIVTFVDTPGAYPGLGAEERGPVDRDRRAIMVMSRLPRPDRHRRHRRGRQRRRARARGRRPRADAGERLLLGDQPRGLRDDPLQGRRRGAARRRRAAHHRARPARARRHGRDRAGAGRRRARRSDGARPPTSRRAIVAGLRELLPLRPRSCSTSRYDRFRVFGDARPPAGPDAHRGGRMTEPSTAMTPRSLLERVWAEARDLIRRLEGTQRAAGRGRGGRDAGSRSSAARRLPRRRRGRDRGPALRRPRRPGRRPGAGHLAGWANRFRRVRGHRPRSTTACRCSRRSSAPSTGPPSPGAKPFVETGDSVEHGQTVASSRR